uniref:hypothetical protein n=1 Tax=Thaumasiovibrio occultus TaxID=1891184 RepID=UPI000B354BAD|nr:hypothetical protein [Thaumasiovibrio occultus]
MAQLAQFDYPQTAPQPTAKTYALNIKGLWAHIKDVFTLPAEPREIDPAALSDHMRRDLGI